MSTGQTACIASERLTLRPTLEGRDYSARVLGWRPPLRIPARCGLTVDRLLEFEGRRARSGNIQRPVDEGDLMDGQQIADVGPKACERRYIDEGGWRAKSDKHNDKRAKVLDEVTHQTRSGT